MKAFVVTIIIIFSICFAQGAKVDSLNIKHQVIGFDKIQHAAVSCLLTLSSQCVLVNKSNMAEDKALSYSIGSSALIGLSKELNDLNRKDGYFSWGDIIADGVGIAIAVLIITN